ncbi:hypothetical protein J4468_03425 [Candidatus Woesearchaeota archaeon]|nr:hypothetical protein [Candidatus Woesearchaeota archaeon]
METKWWIVLLIVALIVGGGIGYFVASYSDDVVGQNVGKTKEQLCGSLDQEACGYSSTCGWSRQDGRCMPL